MGAVGPLDRAHPRKGHIRRGRLSGTPCPFPLPTRLDEPVSGPPVPLRLRGFPAASLSSSTPVSTRTPPFPWQPKSEAGVAPPPPLRHVGRLSYTWSACCEGRVINEKTAKVGWSDPDASRVVGAGALVGVVPEHAVGNRRRSVPCDHSATRGAGSIARLDALVGGHRTPSKEASAKPRRSVGQDQASVVRRRARIRAGQPPTAGPACGPSSRGVVRKRGLVERRRAAGASGDTSLPEVLRRGRPRPTFWTHPQFAGTVPPHGTAGIP